MKPDEGRPNVTIVVPLLETDVESDWLKQCLNSFPEGIAYKLAINDGNVAEAVNLAVAESDTKWIIVFSHDNTAAPKMIDHLLEMGFAADVVYPGVMGVDGEMTERLWAEPVPPYCGNRLLQEQFVPGASMVLRDSFLEIGGYREEAAPFEAWDLWVRGERAGWRFKPCVTTFFQKRLREGSRTWGFDTNSVKDVIVPDPPELKATFYYQATHACAYLRCILPARYLPGIAQGDLYAAIKPKEGIEEPKTADDLEDVMFPFHHGKAAVLQFAGDKSWAMFQHHMQLDGIRTLIEVDDNYLHDPGKRLREKSNWGRAIADKTHDHTYEGHRIIVKWADGVIVTTEALRDSYVKYNDNVFVIPNPVDPWDWRHLRRPDDGVFRIGWFASGSHFADIPLVTRAMEWASRQPNVEVLTMGLRPGWKFPHGNLPWVDDLDAYRMMMGMIDVGVCPVVPDHFAVYRSDIKASEYAMGGAAVVCSEVPPYSHWTHEENCLKARTAKDFYHHIKRLVGNREETKQLAAAGRAWVDENRNIHKLLPLWEEALQVKALVPA